MANKPARGDTKAAFWFTGITEPRWNLAKESLRTKKLLNAAGALTTEGRNAIGRADLWELKDE